MGGPDRIGFLGQGWSFPPSFDLARGSVCLVADEADIQESLQVLMSTMPQERTMLPAYGCNLRQFQFDSAEPALYARIRKQVANAILHFEPRITLTAVDVVLSSPVTGLLTITVSYLIRQTNTRSNMVFPFYLQGEGTNVRQIA